MPKILTVHAPIDGEIIPLCRVPDPVFSERMLGDGLAIDPTGDTIVAPFDGKIINFNPALHAFTIEHDGIELLIHVGVETVMLNGEGFSPLVGEGDTVKQGQPLLQFHPTFLTQRLSCAYVILVITAPLEAKITPLLSQGNATAGQPLFTVGVVPPSALPASVVAAAQNTQDLLLSNVRLFNQPDKTVSLRVQNGKIQEVIPGRTEQIGQVEGRGAYVAPGLIDLHIHGFGGFGPELGTADGLLQMSQALLAQGVTSFCPTLYCGQPKDMENLLHTLSPVVGTETGARILGFHLEGPFISPKKPGVMKPEDIAAADVEVFKRLYEAAQGKITSMTLAPEVPGIEPVIDFCTQHNILLQAGHTNATYEEMEQAKARGVHHVTHFCNAMSPFHHRAPGALGAALMDNDFSCEVIADGVHVNPAIVSFLHRVKPLQNIVLVTDALLPTGQQNGPFFANKEEVVLEGGVWHRKADNVIAGSALTMLQGIKNLVAWDYPLSDALLCATANPARLLGRSDLGVLQEGTAADLILLDKNLNLQKVIH